MGYSYVVNLHNYSTTFNNRSQEPVIEKVLSFEENLQKTLDKLFSFTDELNVKSDYSKELLLIQLDSILSAISITNGIFEQVNVFQNKKPVPIADDIDLMSHFFINLVELNSVHTGLTYKLIKERMKEIFLHLKNGIDTLVPNKTNVFCEISDSQLLKTIIQMELNNWGVITNHLENMTINLLTYLVALEITEPYFTY